MIHDLPRIHKRHGIRYKPGKGDLPALSPEDLSGICWLLDNGYIARHEYLKLLDMVVSKE
jgi:hypothetical protein